MPVNNQPLEGLSLEMALERHPLILVRPIGSPIVAHRFMEAYKTVVEELIPNAQIVADRFHVMNQINEELDARRKEEQTWMITQSGLSSKTLEKTLKKSIKRVLTQKGLSYQRRKGNKELNFLVKKIAQTNLPNLETASKTGEQLGEKIASVSEEKGKQFLDVGVLRQIGSLSSVEALSSVEELWEGSPEKEKPTETTPVSEDVAATETSAAQDEPTSETEEESSAPGERPARIVAL